MKYYSQSKSELLLGFKDTFHQMKKDNRWVKMANTILWPESKTSYSKHPRNQH